MAAAVGAKIAQWTRDPGDICCLTWGFVRDVALREGEAPAELERELSLIKQSTQRFS